ncbi:MAG: PAS domain S-box protein [Desulfobacteraceae bacterium]|jgi:PAS domain S-box-containing protein|nr:MAG: PAS domain S-box protein [Desulfobacteraceae bacterium]
MNDNIADDKFPSANPVPCRSLLSLLAEGITVLARGRVIYANAALCEMTGRNRGEIIGCKFIELVSDSDRKLVSDYLRQHAVTQTGGVDFVLRRTAGAGRWVRLLASPIDLRGIYAEEPGVCCSITDITAFQDRIIELDRDNRRLRSHLDDTESVLMNFAPYDCNDILLVNRYVEALLGCSVGDIMNRRRHLFDFVHPDDLQEVMTFYKGFPEQFETAEMEYRIIRNDRQVRWVRDMGNTLYVERGYGMPRRIDHTIVDITEQKNREMELTEERRKLSSIIKNSTDMIYRVDMAGNFLELNPAGRRLLGIKDDFRKTNILNFYVDPRQRDILLDKLEKTGAAQQLVKWKVADGQVIDVAINAVTEQSAPSDNKTYQGIAHNLTRTLELQRIDTIKKITGGLSDKINTPLMTLSLNMRALRDSLKSGSGDTAEMLEYIEEMEIAYSKIVGPMTVVREKYWKVQEVPDGCGGTIYEIQEKK